jgi:hypothetical protein
MDAVRHIEVDHEIAIECNRYGKYGYRAENCTTDRSACFNYGATNHKAGRYLVLLLVLYKGKGKKTKNC